MIQWHPHSTVATVVEREGRFLMVEERDAGGSVFNQPAGHLDEGETLFEAALRETLEETAWRVALQALLGLYVYRSPHQGTTYIRHCFIASPVSEEAGRPLDEGIIAAHWLTPQEILAPGFPARSPLVRKVLEDYLRGVRHPLDLVFHHNGLKPRQGP